MEKRRNRHKEYREKHKDKLCVAEQVACARKIIESCRDNSALFIRKPVTQEELDRLIYDITSVSLEDVKKIAYAAKPRVEFRKCLNSSNKHVSQIPYETFRNIIYRMYAKELKVPIKTTIFKAINPQPREYQQKYVSDDLAANGFIDMKLPDTNHVLIVEKPEQIYKRMLYLNKIRSYRKQDRNFLYLIYKKGNYSLAVSPKSGMVNFKNLTDLQYVDSMISLKLIEDLLDYVPKSTVIVLDTPGLEETKRLPDQYSSKAQMKNWLYKNGIPYQEEVHAAELYALIQKFKNRHTETCVLSDILVNYGYEFVRVQDPPPLSYFNPIFSQIKELPFKSEAQYIKSIIAKFGDKELHSLEETLMKEETRIYAEDLELESIIDKIRTVTAHKIVLRPDLAACDVYFRKFQPNFILLD